MSGRSNDEFLKELDDLLQEEEGGEAGGWSEENGGGALAERPNAG